MQTPGSYEELAALRCAERQQRALHNWLVAEALAATRPPTRPAHGLTLLLRHVALHVAWRLTRLAGTESGPYTVKEQATLVDAHGNIRTVCPEEIYFVLLPEKDRDAA